MKTLLIMICVVLASCSSFTSKKVDQREEHQKFLAEVESKKASLGKKDYRKYLQQKLNYKVNVLGNLQGQMSNAEGRTTHNELMENSSNQEAHRFNANTNSLEMKRLDERIKLLKREIFFLRSQLSSLEDK